MKPGIWAVREKCSQVPRLPSLGFTPPFGGDPQLFFRHRTRSWSCRTIFLAAVVFPLSCCSLTLSRICVLVFPKGS